MTESSHTYAEADDLLPISDAARMLGVSIATLRRAADEGKIPSSRTFGGQRRFRRADVLAARAAS